MSSVYRIIEKQLVTPGSQTQLGFDTEKFNVGIFKAQRSETEPNGGNVYLQIEGTSNGLNFTPGETKILRAPQYSFFRASQFYLDGQYAGDGMQLAYAYSQYKTYNAVELRLEKAIERLIKTIAATIDDVSITSGISDEQRESDSIVCSVPSASEWRIGTGRLICSVEVIVTSSADGDDAREKHLLRTAYVRDLIMDTTLPHTLSALSDNVTIFNDTVGSFELENQVDSENRRWVSRITFTIHAGGDTFFFDEEDTPYILGFEGLYVGDVDGNAIPAL